MARNTEAIQPLVILIKVINRNTEPMSQNLSRSKFLKTSMAGLGGAKMFTQPDIVEKEKNSAYRISLITILFIMMVFLRFRSYPDWV